MGRAGLTNKQTKHMLRAPGLRGHQAVRSQKEEQGKINEKKSVINWKLTENTGKVQITEKNFEFVYIPIVGIHIFNGGSGGK